MTPRRHVGFHTADDSMEVLSALEFDLTQLDSDVVSGSDTESVDTGPLAGDVVVPPPHRRLRLRWSAFASEQPTMHRDARAVQGFFNDLARRVGSVPREAQLPRAIQRQRWSPVNVPLLWGAASVEETVPVLDWLVAGATAMDEAINFHDGHDQSSGRCENRMGFLEGSDEVMGSVSPC